jgi:hypothetical protein
LTLLVLLLAVLTHRSCLVIFSVHNLSKNDFLAPPFPKASAKVQPFSDSARTFTIIFRKNIKIMENQEKMSVFKSNNEQLERAEVRFSGASKEQRRRAQKAQTLKRSRKNA